MSFQNKISKFILVFLFFSLIIIPFIVEAQEFKSQVKIPGFREGKIGGETLANYIIAFYKWSLRAIGVIAVVMIMVAGFQWMTAAGSVPKITQAKERINNALIGLILVIGAYFLLNFLNPALVNLKSLKIGEIGKTEMKCGIVIIQPEIMAVMTAGEGGGLFSGLFTGKLKYEGTYQGKKIVVEGLPAGEGVDPCSYIFVKGETQENLEKYAALKKPGEWRQASLNECPKEELPSKEEVQKMINEGSGYLCCCPK